MMRLNSPDFDYIRRLVREQSAIVLEDDKQYLAESRLLPVARQEGFDSLTPFVARLRLEPFSRIHRRVVEAMTTNETSFFRDFHPFEALKKSVIPELLARREDKKQLHIWCAASSAGQEPYSVAMLVREYFPSLLGWNLRILASDLSGEMVARAREGRYTQFEVNRGLPAVFLVKYFRKLGCEWQLADDVRRTVEFQVINLAEPWPPLAQMDIIMLRNVLIYFSVNTKKTVLAKVGRQLKPDGYLFLGAAETTFNLDDSFERVQFERAACYRIRKPASGVVAVTGDPRGL